MTLSYGRRRIFFSVRTQKTGKELAFVPSECLFVSCERALRSKQASEPIHGIMDDAVDSLRENDSYGSLARFVEVDRRRLRISESERSDSEGSRYLNCIKSRDFTTMLARIYSLISRVVAVVDDAFILMCC